MDINIIEEFYFFVIVLKLIWGIEKNFKLNLYIIIV